MIKKIKSLFKKYLKKFNDTKITIDDIKSMIKIIYYSMIFNTIIVLIFLPFIMNKNHTDFFKIPSPSILIYIGYLITIFCYKSSSGSKLIQILRTNFAPGGYIKKNISKGEKSVIYLFLKIILYIIMLLKFIVMIFLLNKELKGKEYTNLFLIDFVLYLVSDIIRYNIFNIILRNKLNQKL